MTLLVAFALACITGSTLGPVLGGTWGYWWGYASGTLGPLSLLGLAVVLAVAVRRYGWLNV